MEKSNWVKATDVIPDGAVLGLIWTQFFGKLIPEIQVVYYDNPKDYILGNGMGWLTWIGDRQVYVSHWMVLPDEPADIPQSIEQTNIPADQFRSLKV